MGLALTVDIGSTYTKAVAVNLEAAQIVGRAETHTTVREDVYIGVETVLKELKSQGVGPVVQSLVCSSAAGGLKMVAVGLVPDLTAEAAKRAALGAGAKVAKVYSYEITDDEIEEIVEYGPDLILLAGGTDGGNRKVISENAEKLAASKLAAPIIVAGNKVAGTRVKRILNLGNKEVFLTENVMPRLERLNIEPVRKVIRDVFLSRIIYAKGLSKVKETLSDVIMPTPSAVMRAAQLLSEGTSRQEGLGDILVLDIGGATTDVDSVADGHPTRGGVNLRGLEEPYIKRTVEGDLGMRHSAASLAEAVGIRELISLTSGKIDEDELTQYIKHISEDTKYIPEGDQKNLDDTIAKAAAKHAVNRHAGRIETIYGPMGEGLVQYGKDLTKVKHIVGTGGVIAHSENPGEILRCGTYDDNYPEVLSPVSPKLLADKEYILSCIGLLAEAAPEAAYKLAVKSLQYVD